MTGVRVARLAFVTAILVGQALAPACVAQRSDVGDVSLGACLGNVAKEIPASECPETCSNDVAYAVCNGTEFTSCQCSVPSGFHLDGADSGIVDAQAETGLSPLDTEALGLGPCAGKVVLAIPSSDCAALCTGSTAFAVCDGGTYAGCACSIPKGYRLAVPESSPAEGAGEARLEGGDTRDGPEP
jgi:hypothetical protein